MWTRIEGVDFEEGKENRACQTDYSECELKNDLVLQSLNLSLGLGP